MVGRIGSFRAIVASAIVALVLPDCTALAQNYVTDTVCSVCHNSYFQNYKQSAHPHALTHNSGLVPGPNTWPFTPNPWLPAGLGWTDVELVLGNVFWAAVFVDLDGYVHTGEAAKFNIFRGSHGPYYPEDPPGTKVFDCGKCHTTGYDDSDPADHQFGLEGIVGTWAQEGVRCEACHGPGGDHVDSVLSEDPTVYPPREEALGVAEPGDNWKNCDECHYQDAEFRMPWEDGFLLHGQQAENLEHSPHWFFTRGCRTCHNPHRSTLFGLSGLRRHCTDCHDASEHQVGGGMSSLDCTDCHMPFMAKSAVVFSDYEADVRGHLFQITTEPITSEENVTDGFWNQDENGGAFVTLDYACLKCHENRTVEWAAKYAKDIHNGGLLSDPIGAIKDFVDEAVAAGELTSVGPNGHYIFNYLLDLADDAHAAGNSEAAFWYLVFAFFGCDGNPEYLADLVQGTASDELALMIFEALFHIW